MKSASAFSVTLAHSGKQHSYLVAEALHKLGWLDRFYTSSYITSPWVQNWVMKRGPLYLTRRFQPGLASPQVVANWRFELKEMWVRKRYGRGAQANEAVYARDEAFDQYMAGQIGKRPSQVFWGFQGSCFQTLAAAQRSGKQAVVELASAHVPEALRILGEEKRLLPDWADTIDYLEFPPAYQKRVSEEPHRADWVIAASRFTQQTLEADGVAPEKIRYLPLGFSADYIPFAPRLDDKPSQRPLRLLYAGNLTQRKGLYYLLEAMKGLGHSTGVELTCIGTINGSGRVLEPYKPYFTYKPPVTQLELFGLYGQYDALVLPSIFEGFGLVIVEAMAAGLPVIATPHTMGPELIESGKNGYLIPIRDIGALQQAIGTLRSLTDEQWHTLRHTARQSVEAFTWKAYAHRLETLVNQTWNHV